ncbi:MCE family protein [Nocardia sp. 2]|uniref:MCE family protein n=1 Tax=Nocardia acididurans TaxID=2802282 RepID=A0ABS1MHU2_9NOCA|nr:MCE family protein [Nocardia acididurans]MBL1080192.1 MCE family protein [Nocardia acididurans]
MLATTVIWNTLARNVNGRTNTYCAVFSDVLGLRTGDDVRIAGVRVGKVAAIELDENYNARVTFVVERNQYLHNNTKALVRYQNLMGQRYIALNRGHEGDPTVLANNGVIPLERTEPSFDISVLLNGFQPLFQILSPQQVNTISETLILAVQGDRVSLSSFITQAAALATDFQRRDTILADVIANLSDIMRGLATRGNELETLVTQTRALIGGLYSQGQTLLASTVQIAEATTGLVDTITLIQPQLAKAQIAARDSLTLLILNGDKLDRAAVDFPAMLAAIGKVTQNGAYANAYTCELRISLYGILFPHVGGHAHSDVCRQ